MPEMTEAERRWESWWAAYLKLSEASPEPADVPCPEGDRGRVQRTYYARPGSRIGSVMVWCATGRHGIWLGRVGIPEGVEAHPFDSDPEGMPEIELIPDAMFTSDSDDEDGDDLVP